MKLTRTYPEVAEKKVAWKVGDWFVVDVPGGETLLRRIEYRDGCYSMRDIDGRNNYSVSGNARSANDAMDEYQRVIGPVVKVEIKEVIFEEVIE